MKASIYLRTSTEDQHPEKQKQECIEFANRRGYVVDCIHLEQLSAFKQINRPEYEKIKEKARKGEIQAVIVWALDRWSRNRDEMIHDVTILRTYGCKIHSVKEAYLESINIEGPIGKTIQEFCLGLIGSMAEAESQRRSDRSKMAFKSHKGKKWGRPKVHTNKIKVVLELRKLGMTIQQIHNKCSLSTGKISEILNLHKINDSGQVEKRIKKPNS